MFKSDHPKADKVSLKGPYSGKQSQPPMKAASGGHRPPQTKGAGYVGPKKASTGRVSPPMKPAGRSK